MILGIDPGNKETAIVMLQPHDGTPVFADKMENHRIKDTLAAILEGPKHLYVAGIECVASYGMAVGREVFETAEWSGRIREILARFVAPENIVRVYRREVKLHICGSPKANDANIRKALIDLYPPIGGGSVPQVGTKSKPGPLFGFSKDKWAALGVAITTSEKRNQLPVFE